MICFHSCSLTRLIYLFYFYFISCVLFIPIGNCVYIIYKLANLFLLLLIIHLPLILDLRMLHMCSIVTFPCSNPSRLEFEYNLIVEFTVVLGKKKVVDLKVLDRYLTLENTSDKNQVFHAYTFTPHM